MHFDKYGTKRIKSKVHILYTNTTITKEHTKILDGIVSIKSFLLIFFYILWLNDTVHSRLKKDFGSGQMFLKSRSFYLS